MASTKATESTNLVDVLLEMGVLTRDRVPPLGGLDSENLQLGMILIRMGLITPLDLEAALICQDCLRRGDLTGAHIVIIDYQTRRIERSVKRSEQVVDAGIAALAKKYPEPEKTLN